MRKGMPVLLAVAVMLVALGARAYATESRNIALQAESWRIIDDTNVQMFPADVVNFNKAVYGELTGPTFTNDDYVGVHVPLGPGVLAIYSGDIPMTSGASALFGRLGEPTDKYDLVPSAIMTNTQYATAGIPDGRINAMWGWTMKNGISLAFGAEWFSQVSKRNKDVGSSGTDYTASDSSSMLGIRGGMSMRVGPLDPLTFGLRFGLPEFSGNTSTVWVSGLSEKSFYESTGGTAIDFNIRGRVKDLVAPGSESFIYTAYSTGTINSRSGGSASEFIDYTGESMRNKEKITQDQIVMGFSTNHKVGEASLAMWSLAVQYDTSGHEVSLCTSKFTDGTYKVKKTSVLANTISVPITLGFEMKVFPWLAGRFSSTSSIINRTTTTAKISAEPADLSKAVRVTDNSNQNVALGLTVYAGDKLEIDGVISQNLLFHGPYFIGGVKDDGLFSRVSATFRF